MQKKSSLVIVALALLVVFIGLDLSQYLTLESLRTRQDDLSAWVLESPLKAGLIFASAYIAVTTLSLPGAAIMTLAGGALFGLGWGLLLVSFASSIGATLAFLISRSLLRQWVMNKFGQNLVALNAGITREGGFYLFTLRLVPVFPFFVINLVMGLTPIKARTFYWVSQLGMLPGTAVFVNAGTQLTQIDSLGGLLNPALIGSFTLIGVFPLIAKRLVDVLAARKVYEAFDKPKTFDNDMVVLGAGSGGLVSAYIAATVKAKVTLIERHAMGGDCLNTGCVPSKALIKSAGIAQSMREAREYGIASVEPDIDFAAVMERVQTVIKDIEPHDSIERYTELGVNCMTGEAKVIDPWRVEVNGKVLTTRSIIIATGASPFVPPIPGLDEVHYLTSDTLWELREQPKRLLVIGGGPIGCELTQAFNRLGSQVTQVDISHRIMPREDADVAAEVAARFEREGVCMMTATTPEKFAIDDRKICEQQIRNSYRRT